MHYLNNQLHLILDEEEDPEMLVEDDGWEEEEIEPVEDDEDDAMSGIDSDHADELSSFSD